jgi:hypothetical protein
MRIAAHIARVLLGLMFLMNQISARYRSCSMKLPEDLQLHGNTSRVLDEMSQSIHATSHPKTAHPDSTDFRASIDGQQWGELHGNRD